MRGKLFIAALALLACEVTADGDGDEGGDGASPGTGGSAPSGAAVSLCREACDDALFWDCITPQTHDACYDLCSARSEDDIDTFAACVENTEPFCEGCYEAFEDADPVVPPSTTTSGGGGEEEVGGGPPPDTTCTDACQEYLDAGCDPFIEFPSCVSFCSALTPALQELVVECVEGRDGCQLPDYCDFSVDGGGEGGGGE